MGSHRYTSFKIAKELIEYCLKTGYAKDFKDLKSKDSEELDNYVWEHIGDFSRKFGLSYDTYRRMHTQKKGIYTRGYLNIYEKLTKYDWRDKKLCTDMWSKWCEDLMTPEDFIEIIDTRLDKTYELRSLSPEAYKAFLKGADSLTLVRLLDAARDAKRRIDKFKYMKFFFRVLRVQYREGDEKDVELLLPRLQEIFDFLGSITKEDERRYPFSMYEMRFCHSDILALIRVDTRLYLNANCNMDDLVKGKFSKSIWTTTHQLLTNTTTNRGYKKQVIEHAINERLRELNSCMDSRFVRKTDDIIMDSYVYGHDRYENTKGLPIFNRRRILWDAR